MRPIGYYVHHHGMGHLDRARLIAAQLRRPCTLIGTSAGSAADDYDVLVIPDDAGAETERLARREEVPNALHYAPVGCPQIRARMASIAARIAESDPALVIVDVSVEVALFIRLLSVPTIIFRLAGNRSDAAHHEAFRAARRLVAPLPPQFEDASTPQWVRNKTFYAGFIHQPASRTNVSSEMSRSVTVVLGFGGTHVSINDLIKSASATPDYVWHICGEQSNGLGSQTLPHNLIFHGYVGDINKYVAFSEILIGAAGDSVVSLAVLNAKRFICIPEARPYNEQVAKALVFAACQAAVVRPIWPQAHEWSSLLEEASRIDTRRIEGFRNNQGLSILVEMIEATATTTESR